MVSDTSNRFCSSHLSSSTYAPCMDNAICMQLSAVLSILCGVSSVVCLVAVARWIRKKSMYKEGILCLSAVIALISAVLINVYEGFIGSNSIFHFIHLNQFNYCKQWTEAVIIIWSVNLSTFHMFLLQTIRFIFGTSDKLKIIHNLSIVFLLISPPILVALITHNVIDIEAVIEESERYKQCATSTQLFGLAIYGISVCSINYLVTYMFVFGMFICTYI